MDIYNIESLKEVATKGKNVIAVPLPANTIEQLVTFTAVLEKNEVNVSFEGEDDLVKQASKIDKDKFNSIVNKIYTSLVATVAIANNGSVFEGRLELGGVFNGEKYYIISLELIIDNNIISFNQKLNEMINVSLSKDELNELNLELIDDTLIMIENVDDMFTEDTAHDLANMVFYASKKAKFNSNIVMLHCEDVLSIAIKA